MFLPRRPIVPSENSGSHAPDPCRLCRAQDRIPQQAPTDSPSVVASINGKPRNDHHRNRVRHVASDAPGGRLERHAARGERAVRGDERFPDTVKQTRMTLVIQERRGRWLIAAGHNTEIAPLPSSPQPR